MTATATVLFAREDFSIPGGEEGGAAAHRHGTPEARFFELVGAGRPDIIVLDLSRAQTARADTIHKIRQRTEIPVLVVCPPEQSLFEDYRSAGADDCIAAPVDIIGLNRKVQDIMRGADSMPDRGPDRGNCSFAGINFFPSHNLLVGENGSRVDLTGTEGRLLALLVAKPRTLCTRSEIAALLYGPGLDGSDRALDIVVRRLRGKLTSVSSDGAADELIQTEFRRGYLLAANVTPLSQNARAHAA